MRFFGILGIIIICSLGLVAQNHRITGIVTDSKTGESLAFVNIIYNKANQGLASDINGRFEINSKQPIDFLQFSYVGYKPHYHQIKPSDYSKTVQIELEQKDLNIDEIVVQAGENPAHRIIYNVMDNKKINNPEKMTSFSYTSYNKLVFTVDLDALQDSVSEADKTKNVIEDTTASKPDTTKTTLREFFTSQDLFLMESVTKRQFMRPNNNNEKVIASRTSGLKSASFLLLATQLQSFSFYKDIIEIGDKKYINPIAFGGTRRYFFMIEDTIYNEEKDTIFVISYRPRKGKNFDGLEGVLNINSNKYAIESVIAIPANKEDDMQIRIQQKYEHIEKKQWFPVQLNTDIIFSNANVVEDTTETFLVCIGKTYLKDIVLNPEFKRREFNHIELVVEENAHKKDEDYWLEFRDTLAARDQNTYRVIDSVGDELKLDKKLQIAEIVFSGYIPWGYFNFDIMEIMRYNEHEGFRLGCRIITNDKLASWFSVGGYGAYGFRDEKFKYGAETSFLLYKPTKTKLRFSYQNDVEETAGYSFYNDENLKSSASIRKLFVNDMTKVEQKKVEFQFRFLRYFGVNSFARQVTRSTTNDYIFGNAELPETQSTNWNSTEVGLQVRFAYREKFMQTPKGTRISLGTNFPVVFANYSRGIDYATNDVEYERFEIKIKKDFLTKFFGRTSISAVAGICSPNAPYGLLYNGHGSYLSVFNVHADESFSTMRMNEFTANKFAAVFLKQDFGHLLFRTKTFEPEIAIVTNIGYGEFSGDNQHINIETKDYRNGYFESGILINNLIKQMSIFGYGVGVFYRYGAYELPEAIDNFAFKLSLTMNF